MHISLVYVDQSHVRKLVQAVQICVVYLESCIMQNFCHLRTLNTYIHTQGWTGFQVRYNFSKVSSLLNLP